jgi:hypothetical protein
MTEKEYTGGRCLSVKILGTEWFQCEKEYNHEGPHMIQLNLEWSD